MTLLKSIFLLTVMASWALAESQWQSYSILKYPKNAKSCQETAENLGATFSAVSGQANYRAICQKEAKDSYDILISYVAQAPVSLVSTIFESGGTGSLGVYFSVKECQSALFGEVDTFVKSTGLSPLLSYCYKESSLGTTPYFARIDAIGIAKLYPYRFEWNVFADSIGNQKSVLEEMKASAKSMGIPIHHSVFSNDALTRLVLRYYMDPKQALLSSNLFRLNDLARYSSLGAKSPMQTCQSQLLEAQNGFRSEFKRPGIWFCGWDKTLFQSRLYVLRIRPEEWIRSDSFPERFQTYEACDSERTGAAEWFKKAFGISPFVILCNWRSELGTGSPGGFALRLLSKTSEPEVPSGPDADLRGHMEVSRD